jgi:DNA-binding NtrC family response regulator
MAKPYEPPMDYADALPSAVAPVGKLFEARMSDWVPHPTRIPEGAPPLAVRIIRAERPAKVVPLQTSKGYRIGRLSNSDLWFEDSAVSRLHGLLYYVPEISGWAFRDPVPSTLGTFAYATEGSGERQRVSSDEPICVVAGQSLALGTDDNRLEFLDSALEAGLRAERYKSKAARALEDSIQAAAKKRGPVVLFGPSGAGKTFLAQRIHQLSDRKHHSFVLFNCALLPEEADKFVSEMLGHVPGSYTGASSRRKGCLLQADKGTLFLDEVESVPPKAQPFLLDLLDGQGDLRPLGADTGVPRPDVRFICATKAPLDAAGLREDLVNRLVRGHRVVIPTLDERREDIPLLAQDILETVQAELDVEADFNEEAVSVLGAQTWPGHVRQLKDALYSALDGHSGGKVLLTAKFQDLRASEETVRRGHANAREAPTSATPADSGPVRKRPVDMTREDLEAALLAAGGNRTKAADALQMSPTTLLKKLREHGLA